MCFDLFSDTSSHLTEIIIVIYNYSDMITCFIIISQHSLDDPFEALHD